MPPIIPQNDGAPHVKVVVAHGPFQVGLPAMPPLKVRTSSHTSRPVGLPAMPQVRSGRTSNPASGRTSSHAFPDGKHYCRLGATFPLESLTTWPCAWSGPGRTLTRHPLPRRQVGDASVIPAFVRATAELPNSMQFKRVQDHSEPSTTAIR